MGEVYRARDTRLDRTVAIKVMPPGLASDAQFHARFDREARAISQLQHPHICTLHDVGEEDGTAFLVMELLQGQTLAERLRRGALPLDDALKIGREVADALSAAHRQGIVHRDLKPANIMLTKSGAKLLDFGLAKPSRPVIAMAATIPQDTASTHLTGAGTILGTLHYMAPEQVEGREADTRSDIWALGTVVYEMVAGTRPFDGVTPASVVSAILRDTPAPIAWRQPITPPALDRLVSTCLAKDPEDRWQSAADLKHQLESIRSIRDDDVVRAGISRQTGSSRWRMAAPWAICAAAAAAAAWSLLTRDPALQTPDVVTRLEMNYPPHVEVATIAAPSAGLSPDGRRVVFTGQEAGFRRLYVRELDSGQARMFVATDASSQCYFSPDGSAIVYIASDRVLRRMALADGLTTVLARGVDRNLGASWGDDGQVSYVSGGELWQVPGSGGEPQKITTVDRARGELFHAWPTALPGTSTVLFTVISGGTRDAQRIDAVDRATGTRRTVVDVASYPLVSREGPLVFLREGILVAAMFDRQRLTVTGPAVKVLEDVALDQLGAPLASFSPSGSLVYVSNEAASGRLVWVSRSGATVPASDAHRVWDYPRLSPDGARMAVSVSGDLWQLDPARSTVTRITAEAAVGNSYAAWMPDGQRVVYRTATGLRIGRADGSGETYAIPETAVTDFPHAVTRDGNTLLFTRQTADASGEVYVLTLSGEPKPHALFTSPTYEGGAVLSPDGRWVAYSSNESGRYEVYVRPFPGGGPRWTASTDGGNQAVWSHTGKELFYRNGSKMMAVPVSFTPDLTLGRPQVLFDLVLSFGTGITFAQYDVANDGRFVMIQRDTESGRLNVVLNWAAELKRLARPH